MKTYSLLHMPSCWDVGTRWYLQRFYTSDKEDYFQNVKYVSFWLHAFCGKWEGWDPVKRFNHASFLAIFTQTNPKLTVLSRSAIVV